MVENNPSDVKLDENPDGTVSFATDVVATIAGLAATEVEGVASMSSPSSALADMFSRKNTRNFTKGVRIDLDGNCVTVDVTIVVEYGSPVPDVARSIQENVQKGHRDHERTDRSFRRRARFRHQFRARSARGEGAGRAAEEDCSNAPRLKRRNPAAAEKAPVAEETQDADGELDDEINISEDVDEIEEDPEENPDEEPEEPEADSDEK